MKVNASNTKNWFLLLGFLAPLLAVSLLIWVNHISSNVASTLSSQKLSHMATQGLISRDIDDLQTQLQNSLRDSTFLPGDFRFQPEKNRLSASHSSRPEQPIRIELEDSMPFTRTLNNHEKMAFVITTQNKEILSYSKNSSKLAHNVVGDHNIASLKENSIKAFKGFDNTRPFELSFYNLIKGPRYAVFKSTIQGSNLSLYSFQKVSTLWSEAILSLFFIFLGFIFAIFLGALFISKQKKSHQKNQAWLNRFVTNLRFGKFEEALQTTSEDNSVFLQEIKTSLQKSSSLKRFVECDWIDRARATVSWSFFKAQITHWSEGLSIDPQEAPKQWHLGSIRFSDSRHFESFASTISRHFMSGSLFICQANDTEAYIATRDYLNPDFVYRIKKALREWTNKEQLFSNQFSLDVLFVREETPGKVFNMLESVSKNASALFLQTQKGLGDKCVEIRNQKTNTPLIGLGMNEIVNSTFYKIDEVASTETKLGFPKKTAVLKSKTRPKLPPPPVLRSKNRNQNSKRLEGRGFVKIVDALGRSEWVEISPSNPRPDSLIEKT